jgi:hypothetical protein
MRLILAAIFVTILAAPAFAQRCKYDVETESHRETGYFLMFRGGIVGLGGHFGVRDGEGYLRGRYPSQFKARAEFTAETPLEIALDNGEMLTLKVISEDRARLRFFGAAFNNREAEPVYALSPANFGVLATNRITSLKLNFVVDGEEQSTEREVKQKHAENIVEALRCLDPPG